VQPRAPHPATVAQPRAPHPAKLHGTASPLQTSTLARVGKAIQPMRRRSARLDDPWKRVVQYSSIKSVGKEHEYVRVRGDHAVCIIRHEGKDYVFNGNDSVSWKKAPPDGFQDYNKMDCRPLMKREEGLLHHKDLLELEGGRKGVCYAAAHACAVIWEKGQMSWTDFLLCVQTNDLSQLVGLAQGLE